MVTPPRTVVILCGPPGAGKTTIAKSQDQLTVYDRDDPQWNGEAHFRAALADLAHNPRAQAVVIRAGATSSARHKARQLTNATHLFLVVEPPDECVRRVRARYRHDFVTGMASVKTWFNNYDHDDHAPTFTTWANALAPLGALSESF